MCIAVAKPADVQLPETSILENCFMSNPDGGGFSFVKNNVVHIVKGLMTIEEYLYALKEANLKQRDAILYHFRIATTGSVVPENCHPFPLSNKVDDLKATEHKGECSLIHNGVLGYTTDKKDDLSDTQQFTRDLADLGGYKALKSLRRIINLVAHESSSKFAVLTKFSTIWMMGHFQKHKGIFYSNSTYQDYQYPSIRGYGYGLSATSYGNDNWAEDMQKAYDAQTDSDSPTDDKSSEEYLYCKNCKKEFDEEGAEELDYTCNKCFGELDYEDISHIEYMEN